LAAELEKALEEEQEKKKSNVQLRTETAREKRARETAEAQITHLQNANEQLRQAMGEGRGSVEEEEPACLKEEVACLKGDVARLKKALEEEVEAAASLRKALEEALERAEEEASLKRLAGEADQQRDALVEV
jgi:hypothetical protein